MKVAAIVPCYKVKKHIHQVVEELLDFVDIIFVVDDCCPEGSGRLVKQKIGDNPRVTVIFHEVNKGVGGAMVTGYRAALTAECEICVKVDGDGQMDPGYIEVLIYPIKNRNADYTKGNRFYHTKDLISMPKVRLFGNTMLSFINKISTGYWNVMDPTNGYTAIHRTALKLIDLDRLAERYFFESDMLFRLSTVRAVVWDVSMPSIYGDETSNLRVSRVLRDFPQRYLVNFFKRFFYTYILRDMNSASIEAIVGSVLVVFALFAGGFQWLSSWETGNLTPLGTIMVVALAAILGTQFLLASLAFDVSNVPKDPLQTMPSLQLEPRPLRSSHR